MSSYSHPFRCLAPTKRKSLNHRRQAERWSDTYLRIEIGSAVVRRSTSTYVPAYVPKYVPMYTTHVAVHFRPHLTNKEKRQKSSLSSQTPPDRCSQGCHRVDKKKRTEFRCTYQYFATAHFAEASHWNRERGQQLLFVAHPPHVSTWNLLRRTVARWPSCLPRLADCPELERHGQVQACKYQQPLFVTIPSIAASAFHSYK